MFNIKIIYIPKNCISVPSIHLKSVVLKLLLGRECGGWSDGQIGKTLLLQSGEINIPFKHSSFTNDTVLLLKINVHILLTCKLPAAFQVSLKIGSSREFFNCTHSSSFIPRTRLRFVSFNAYLRNTFPYICNLSLYSQEHVVTNLTCVLFVSIC